MIVKASGSSAATADSAFRNPYRYSCDAYLCHQDARTYDPEAHEPPSLNTWGHVCKLPVRKTAAGHFSETKQSRDLCT